MHRMVFYLVYVSFFCLNYLQMSHTRRPKGLTVCTMDESFPSNGDVEPPKRLLKITRKYSVCHQNVFAECSFQRRRNKRNSIPRLDN